MDFAPPPDRDNFQTEDEYKKTKDPVNLVRHKLIAEGILTEAEAKQIDREKKAEADAAAKFAEDSPNPPKSELQTDVYWEVDNDSTQALKGTHFFND